MYHYTECGLNTVWLANGYRTLKTPYGPSVAIERADELHRAIALSLVGHKPRLSGGEFRFVRKEMDLSQAALAAILGNDAQSIARWEKGGHIPKMAERFVRALYREHAEGNARIKAMIERISQLDGQRQTKMVFEETGGAWEPQKAA